jgi:hypothetical protein
MDNGKLFMKVIDKTLSQAGIILVASLLLVSCVSQPTQQPAATVDKETKPAGSAPQETQTASAEPTREADQEPSAGVVKEPSAGAVKEPSAGAVTEPPVLSSDTPPNQTDLDQQSPVAQEEIPLGDTPPDMEDPQAEFDPDVAAAAVRDLCERIGRKLGSVKSQDCFDQPLIHAGTSTNGLSLAYRDYLPLPDRTPLGRVLVLGGIHGDEFSSVSVLFKWLKILDQHHSGLFHWRFVPVVNPDGLLQTKSQRQNSNGVDLNRNFPTSDWNTDAHRYWREKTYRNPRRYPGTGPASEVETQWVLEQLESFAPDVVISMHAPYHLVDYDGPPKAPENLGGLYLRKLGVYPGSLGNYVGVDLNKPIVTVELKSAGIMPTKSEIESMWGDLIHWLRQQLGE